MPPSRHERRYQEFPSFPYFCGAAWESHGVGARKNDRGAVVTGLLPLDSEQPNTNSQTVLRDRQLPPRPTTGHRVCVEIAFLEAFAIWTQSRRGLLASQVWICPRADDPGRPRGLVLSSQEVVSPFQRNEAAGMTCGAENVARIGDTHGVVGR